MVIYTTLTTQFDDGLIIVNIILIMNLSFIMIKPILILMVLKVSRMTCAKPPHFLLDMFEFKQLH
jgi:uncharacterized protein YebE (UPF0316 family)